MLIDATKVAQGTIIKQLLDAGILPILASHINPKPIPHIQKYEFDSKSWTG